MYISIFSETGTGFQSLHFRQRKRHLSLSAELRSARFRKEETNFLLRRCPPLQIRFESFDVSPATRHIVRAYRSRCWDKNRTLRKCTRLMVEGLFSTIYKR